MCNFANSFVEYCGYNINRVYKCLKLNMNMNMDMNMQATVVQILSYGRFDATPFS